MYPVQTQQNCSTQKRASQESKFRTIVRVPSVNKNVAIAKSKTSAQGNVVALHTEIVFTCMS